MRRRVALGFLAGAVLGAALGRLWPRPPPEAAPIDGASAAVPLTPRARPAAWVEVPAPADAPASPAPESPPRGHAAALRALARLTGDAVLRCDGAGLLPEGPVVGLARATVEDGALLAVVEEGSGEAQVRLPDDLPSDPPLAVVRWWGAWDADARCVVEPAVEVVVTGRLLDAAGAPVTDAEVGNAVDGGAPVDAEGSWSVRCWKDSACPIASRRVGGAWGRPEVLVPAGDVEGLTLRLDEPAPAPDLRSWLEQRVAEGERLEEQPDPLRMALRDPELDETGRAVLRAWLDQQSEDRATERELLSAL